jgi:hypothetical protein
MRIVDDLPKAKTPLVPLTAFRVHEKAEQARACSAPFLRDR